MATEDREKYNSLICVFCVFFAHFAIDRKPHSDYSALILELAESLKLDAFIAWHTIANFYYLVSSASGDKKTRRFIRELLSFTNVVETSTSDATIALDYPLTNFEDALQVAAARKCSAQHIITRNIKHYKKSIIPAITPRQFLSMIGFNHFR